MHMIINIKYLINIVINNIKAHHHKIKHAITFKESIKMHDHNSA